MTPFLSIFESLPDFISMLLESLLLGLKLLQRLLLAEESDLRGHLLEDALLVVGELVHHLQSQLLDHL